MNNENNIQIQHYISLDSTNTTALNLDNAPHLLTVVADTQTGGRGRMGRTFYSDHEGLYMSVVIHPDKIKCTLPLCTPAAAAAVREALENVGIGNVKIKWVNDLLLDDRKVCGILTEARSAEGKIDKIVVGIGINLMPPKDDFPDEIKDKAGAVNYTGDKLALAGDIARRLGRYIGSDKETVCGEYRKHLAFMGNETEVTDYADGNRKIRGTVVGVDENGFLQIETADGKVRVISSGEIMG